MVHGKLIPRFRPLFPSCQDRFTGTYRDVEYPRGTARLTAPFQPSAISRRVTMGTLLLSTPGLTVLLKEMLQRYG